MSKSPNRKNYSNEDIKHDEDEDLRSPLRKMNLQRRMSAYGMQSDESDSRDEDDMFNNSLENLVRRASV